MIDATENDSGPLLPDRETPKMPPFTSLKRLQVEHERLRSLQGTSMAVRKMTFREWRGHLEDRLWIKPKR